MAEPCWFGILLGDPHHCQNEGKWKAPKELQTNGLMRDSVWCDEHKHDTDVPVEKEDDE